jgi:hypothetical protein
MLAEKTNFTITRMVRLLDVSRSGYYAWIGRPPSPASLRRVHIEQKVAFFHGDSDEVYGAPRILADLRADGEIKTVAVTMKRLGLAGICPKKWKTTTIIDHADAYPVDAVKREWDTGAQHTLLNGFRPPFAPAATASVTACLSCYPRCTRIICRRCRRSWGSTRRSPCCSASVACWYSSEASPGRRRTGWGVSRNALTPSRSGAPQLMKVVHGTTAGPDLQLVGVENAVLQPGFGDG